MNRTANWMVRVAGEPPRILDNPHQVLEGLRDGDWETADEVRGPAEQFWKPIEDHPTFADAVAEMGPEPPEPADETHLDMNPLIDVALVLLVFFILTATVSSLRRTIDVPSPPAEDSASRKPPEIKDVEDRIFRVQILMDSEEKPVITIDKRAIVFERVEQEIAETVKTTGRKEMLLKASDDVPWEVFVQVQGAANKGGVRTIHIPSKK
jgi:biopolymer transport protein ExbD